MGEEEERVCPDDGRVYTFQEFEIEYCFRYSATELETKWNQMERAGQQDTQGGPEKTGLSDSASSDWMVIDPTIVVLAQNGEASALQERLHQRCNPNVLAFEYGRHGARVYCNDWTPLTAAVVAGNVDIVRLLISANADANVLCCVTNASGSYSSWSALDCARTGETIPFERDPLKHLQPRHPEIEKCLLA